VVASGLFHAFGDTVDLLYNGSDEAALELRPNHTLYWTVIQWAIENGFRKFDWGAGAEGSSLAAFKAQWSSEPVHEYRYDLVLSEASDRTERIRHSHDALDHESESTRERLMRAAWDRAPLPATRLAGEVVYRLF
jgi:lipid II:glycine glycyltransferase (peptidoglycan interpeptide bridge formation enzyme)